MGVDPDRFKRASIEVLAKRSAGLCSNPECRAFTSGPSNSDNEVLNVGEAAHIYGANPGSARYDAKMLAVERSAITNAIWLCRNCHKIIDSDSIGYPASLLFEWKNEHERDIINSLGKTNDRMRRIILERDGNNPLYKTHISRQILIDRPIGWEYRLTAELLRIKTAPILMRARALERGLYARPVKRLLKADGFLWFEERFIELSNFGPAAAGIINIELPAAWGAPGEPGCPNAILDASNLFEDLCQQILDWEEKVRFTLLPIEFRRLGVLISGLGLRLLNQINEVPLKMVEMFSGDEIEGEYKISITINLPQGWEKDYENEIKRLAVEMSDN